MVAELLEAELVSVPSVQGHADPLRRRERAAQAGQKTKDEESPRRANQIHFGQANGHDPAAQREVALASPPADRPLSRVPRRPRFRRYLGIDYSGAATPETRLPGLRVYAAEDPTEPPREVTAPAASGRWSRRELARWLTDTLSAGAPTLVGIDHGLSCPLPYFERHALPANWDRFLADFTRHWPAHAPGVTVRSLRASNPRAGDPRWRRPCERRTGAKSVFHFDVPGSVATSTHAGLAWVQRLREELGPRLHCWPFDGWHPPLGAHLLAEIYPSRWSGRWPRGQRTPDQQDAFATAAALAAADHSGELERWLDPELPTAERAATRVEGWILGVS
jgi:hypothetical protein